VSKLHPAGKVSVKGVNYQRYAEIIQTLSDTPGMYDKETGWTEASQDEFKKIIEGVGNE
jgi:hypothetical protein